MDDKIFKKLQRNVEKSIAHAQGNQVRGIRVHRVKVPEEVDVAAIRHRLHMTQEIFAATFGFSVSGLKKWEAKEQAVFLFPGAFLSPALLSGVCAHLYPQSAKTQKLF